MGLEAAGRTIARWAGVAGCLMLCAACDRLSDPATSLAYCIEGALKQPTRDGVATQTSCDLKKAGSYLLVLHPEGELSDEQLVSAGVPPDLLPELRELRLGTNAAIYVIATDPGVSGTGSSRSILSNRTTYQKRFVQIDKLIVLAKTTQPVSVDIGGSPQRRVIDGLH